MITIFYKNGRKLGPIPFHKGDFCCNGSSIMRIPNILRDFYNREPSLQIGKQISNIDNKDFVGIYLNEDMKLEDLSSAVLKDSVRFEMSKF